MFGVILGTGVGGGAVVNGAALVGPNAISGEWGHNPLPWPRPDELPGDLCVIAGSADASKRSFRGRVLPPTTKATGAAGRRRR